MIEIRTFFGALSLVLMAISVGLALMVWGYLLLRSFRLVPVSAEREARLQKLADISRYLFFFTIAYVMIVFIWLGPPRPE